MNAPITIDASMLEKVAETLSQSAVHLEKAAAYEEQLKTAVPQWVDAAVTQGVLRPENRDSTINDLITGGVQKQADFVSLLLRNASPRTLGGAVGNEKVAGKSTDLSAHDLFAQRMLS